MPLSVSGKVRLTLHALQWLTLGLWAIWLVGYWWGRLPFNRHDGLDTALILAIALGSAVIFITGVVICLEWVEITTLYLPPAVTVMGMVLVMLGIGGTVYARRCLGRFWTAEAVLQSDHQVIETGPYGYVRHPIYTAAILLNIGTLLVFATYWTLIAGVVVGTAYILKAKLEDHLLAVNLPGYPVYQTRVPYRLFPFIW